MPKNIVFCADGTWDSPPDETNVVKIFRALLHEPGQIAAYDDGVGSDGTALDKLAGGAFGVGLLQKVQDGYTQIAHLYESGDRIFIFGFSRGAYTARSLAGMIAVCGLPTENFDAKLVATAFAAYRNPSLRSALPQALAGYAIENAKITLLGVWDTVGSLGIPALFGGIEKDYQFLDTTLHPDVLNACHAVSIDERRTEFPPTLWTGPLAPGQLMEQTYFAGVHCDVGGGYNDDSKLADITLRWMMRKGQALGLNFDPSILAGIDPPFEDQYALGMLHQSWDPLWGFSTRRAVATDAGLADSVAVRAARDATYQPPNLAFSGPGQLKPSYPIRPAMA